MPDEKDDIILDEDLVAAQGGLLGGEGVPVAAEIIVETEPGHEAGLDEHHIL